jgi:sortase A
LPGQLGNAALAGHRTTYGQPFHDVDRLKVGDEIVTTTPNGRFVYRVTAQQIVAPSDYYVVETTNPDIATLTLTSCHPKWTARQRIVIFSELEVDASSPVGAPIINYGRNAPDGAPTELPSDPELPLETDPPATDLPTTDPAATVDTAIDGATTESSPSTSTAPETTATPTTSAPVAAAPVAVVGDAEVIADAFGEGWFSDPDAHSQVALWGLLLALVGIAATLLSRKFGTDLVGGLVGIVPFLVTLYFFYQTVNRLLPPNL